MERYAGSARHTAAHRQYAVIFACSSGAHSTRSPLDRADVATPPRYRDAATPMSATAASVSVEAAHADDSAPTTRW